MTRFIGLLVIVGAVALGLSTGGASAFSPAKKEAADATLGQPLLADAPTIVLVVSRFVIEPGAILEVTFWVAAMMGAEAAMDRQGPAETESVASLEAPQRIVVRRVAAPSKSGRLVNPRLVWSTGLFR